MAFITQRASKKHENMAKIAEETQALEALVSGVNQISQSTLLLKKKKEMHEVDDALDFMKEEYKLRIEACEQRQRKFERRQADMKEQVTKFEKFIQENDSKRQRADMKAKGEHRVLDQKELEQRKQTLELEALELERTRQIEQLEKLRKYKEYLERTVESAEDETAEEIWDLLNRHTTLRNANVDLMEQVQRGDVLIRAGQESEIPNFKGSFLGRFPLVLADFWTSDHLSERSRNVDAFSGTRARGTLTLKRR